MLPLVWWCRWRQWQWLSVSRQLSGCWRRQWRQQRCFVCVSTAVGIWWCRWRQRRWLFASRQPSGCFDSHRDLGSVGGGSGSVVSVSRQPSRPSAVYCCRHHRCWCSDLCCHSCGGVGGGSGSGCLCLDSYRDVGGVGGGSGGVLSVSRQLSGSLVVLVEAAAVAVCVSTAVGMFRQPSGCWQCRWRQQRCCVCVSPAVQMLVVSVKAARWLFVSRQPSGCFDSHRDLAVSVEAATVLCLCLASCLDAGGVGGGSGSVVSVSRQPSRPSAVYCCRHHRCWCSDLCCHSCGGVGGGSGSGCLCLDSYRDVGGVGGGSGGVLSVSRQLSGSLVVLVEAAAVAVCVSTAVGMFRQPSGCWQCRWRQQAVLCLCLASRPDAGGVSEAAAVAVCVSTAVRMF